MQFARTEGIIPAPESAHAIRVAIDEAQRCKRDGKRRTILFNLSGHGHFDLGAYEAHLAGKLQDYEYPAAKVDEALKSVPKVVSGRRGSPPRRPSMSPRASTPPEAGGGVRPAHVCVLHFTNHALGLVSLNAMETGRWWFLALWRSAPGTLALYGAIAVHGILALWLLYDRRTLRMPAWEAAQYALGLALPALLVTHVVGTRIAWWRFGAEDPYSRILMSLWLQAPEVGAPPCGDARARVAPRLHRASLLAPLSPLVSPRRALAASRWRCSCRLWPCWASSPPAARSPRARDTPGWTEAMLRGGERPRSGRGRAAARDPERIPRQLSRRARRRHARSRGSPATRAAALGADHSTRTRAR